LSFLVNNKFNNDQSGSPVGGQISRGVFYGLYCFVW